MPKSSAATDVRLRQLIADATPRRALRLSGDQESQEDFESVDERLEAELDEAYAVRARKLAKPLPNPRESKLWEFGKSHLAGVAVVLITAVIFVAFQINRAQSAPIPEIQPSVVVSSATPTSSASTKQFRIHIYGQVTNPGVISCSEGSRVIDVVDKAAGFTDQAWLGELNLAEPVPDGAQIYVGTGPNDPSQLRGANTESQSSQNPSSKINLNTATQSQLETLPGVGPATAQAIINYRDTNGTFSDITQLQNVDGIGAKTFAKLSGLVTV
uniref:helix-hairpin-helix domain-containing protein n=1 Tax=Vaginimicrobium propionicum TaxID=1871034 RepID=UPI000970A071|nr:helix-hairpin-helix domain-containing protein [Vaginimicrobium propionicum]